MSEDALNTLVQYIDGRLEQLRTRLNDSKARVSNSAEFADIEYYSIMENAVRIGSAVAQIRELESVLKIIKALQEGETDEGNHHQTGA